MESTVNSFLILSLEITGIFPTCITLLTSFLFLKDWLNLIQELKLFFLNSKLSFTAIINKFPSSPNTLTKLSYAKLKG